MFRIITPAAAQSVKEVLVSQTNPGAVHLLGDVVVVPIVVGVVVVGEGVVVVVQGYLSVVVHL